MMTTQEVVRNGKAQLGDLIGLVADSVSSLSKVDGGWKLVINMIELKRIPPSTDVLASFDVSMDEAGNVIDYQRSRRYRRDQMMEDAS